MKGLFIKDLKLIKNQRISGIVFSGIILLYLLTNMSEAFILGYALFLCASLTTGTISYDEYDNGYVFLFTMPFSRRDYVLEKYIFTAVTGIVACTATFGLTILADKIRGTEIFMPEYTATALVILAIFFILVSVMLPTQLKFSGSRGSIIMILFFMFGALLAWITATILKETADISLFTLRMEAMFSDTAYALAPGLAATAVGILFLLISCRISIGIVNRKEF